MSKSQVSYTNQGDRPLTGGAGVTIMKWGTDIVGFCNGVTVTWPQAVATEVEVHPLDSIRPLEIVTSRAITGGKIDLTLTTLYNKQIWDRLAGLAGAHDLADIFQFVQDTYYSNNAKGLTVSRVIYPAVGNRPVYQEDFLGCVVTNVADGIGITNSTMLVDRQLTIAFASHQKIGNGWADAFNAPVTLNIT